MVAVGKKLLVKCYHCGDSCKDSSIELDHKVFCCEGCKTVYGLLQDNQMCEYYALESAPGAKIVDHKEYAFLEEPAIANSILNFNEGEVSGITFYIPSIHCSSCIWLLEHLHKLHSGIISSKIQFQQKKLDVQFKNTISLRKLAELLASIGYAPQISLNGKIVNNKSVNKKLYYKLGIAGFCFGNIMMLSLPDYLSVVDEFEGDIKMLFGILSFILALPVFFYSASDYFVSAYTSIKTKIINIDLPIALGLTAAFGQSIHELFVDGGIGYMDSLTGLVFFLLIGKWYQSRTYESISFDRDFKSYFPLAACKINGQKEEYTALKDLAINDVLLIRNEEIIPSDAILIDGVATIDYSFVTGESRPILKNKGELLFAGGRQKGASITIKLTKTVSESYLTQLWNKDDSKQSINGLENFTNKVGKYFTIAVLIISALTCFYWLEKDITVAIHASIAVLIIFCPCTLALAIPFGFGRAMNALGKNGLFLKNTQVIEKLASNTAIVFDKTGTLTKTGLNHIELKATLNEEEKLWIKSIVQHSTHPLSRSISNYFSSIENKIDVEGYSEILSKGLEGSVDGHNVRLGATSFVGLYEQDSSEDKLTKVYISIDNSLKGYFQFENLYRDDLDNVLKKLSTEHDIHLLSGDNDSEKTYLQKYFRDTNLHFWQSPTDKLEYLKRLGKEQKVIMIGDGLNDAGALIHSHCGISITEKKSSFSPASDAILDAEAFDRLPDFISYAKKCLNRVYWSLAVSMVYNITGLYFAIQGNLKPIVAALLMPMSSVSVVLFVTIIAPRLESTEQKPKPIN